MTQEIEETIQLLEKNSSDNFNIAINFIVGNYLLIISLKMF